MTEKLSQEELNRLDKAIGSHADKLISAHYKSLKNKPRIEDVEEPKTSNAGRKPTMLTNTVVEYIGKTTPYGLYPYWALDIIEGVARLDWDSKPSDSPLKSSPLSVRSLCTLLATFDELSTDTIEKFLGIGKRHAQRYLKACSLMMPHLERSTPKKSVSIQCIQWLDLHDLIPDPEQLAKLHYDMRDLN